LRGSFWIVRGSFGIGAVSPDHRLRPG